MIKTGEYIDFGLKTVYERWEREENENWPFHIMPTNIERNAPRPPSGDKLSSLSTPAEYAVEIEAALINDRDYMTLQGRRELIEFVRSKHKQRPGEG